MTEVKTHWKKLHNPDYIGAYTLMDGDVKELVVKFASVKTKEVQSPDGKKEQCVVAELIGQKPMILNATNMKALQKLSGSPYVEDWNGLQVTLYVAQVKAFGDVVDALRIRPTLPTAPAKPELTPTHPKWNGAVKALAAGNTTIEAIKSAYVLSEASEAQLSKEVSDGTK
jgi:hypothetical protein